MLLVPNKDTLKNVPPAQGLLAFRPKNQQLLVQGQKGWSKIAMEKEVCVLYILVNIQFSHEIIVTHAFAHSFYFFPLVVYIRKCV